MTIIPGAFYQKIKKEIAISSPVIGPKGSIIGRQEKIHPFDYEKKLWQQERRPRFSMLVANL